MAVIYPIGHISLDSGNPEARHLGLPLPDTGVYWIKTFYVSHVLQNRGVGRAAMDMIEAMAVEEPLCAKVLALDTVHKDDQIRPEFFEANGQQPRKVRFEKRRGVVNLY